MTHADLVKLAERWVRSTQRRYSVVLSDVHMTCVTEQPDVFAAGVGGTLLVECKTSRADFLADAAKSFRREPSTGVGGTRYYCAPAGLLSPADLPDDWGLLEPNARGTKLKIAWAASRHFTFEANWRAERTILVSALQRATDGWGRRVFGDIAPAMIDGDPHPSSTAIIRKQRAEIDRLREELCALKRAAKGGA